MEWIDNDGVDLQRLKDYGTHSAAITSKMKMTKQEWLDQAASEYGSSLRQAVIVTNMMKGS
jgi:hypothetical protein